MSTIIASLLSFLLLYKYWALLVLTFSAAVILPIPMNTVLLAAGAFASQGYFNIYYSFIAVVVANVAGDFFGYMLARVYGHRALKILRIRELSSMKNLDGYIKNHSRLTIFLTRFIGAFGSIVNLLAGFIPLPIGLFLMYDFIGNVVSTGIILYAGYFLGIHWQDFSGLFNLIGWSIIGLIFIIIFVLWSVRHKRK